MIILLAGLPGTGKSTIAHELAGPLSAVILDKDRVRAALFAQQDIDYSTSQDDLCVRVIAQVAGHLLQRDPTRSIIVDGRTFTRRYQVEEWRNWATVLGVPLKILECVCADETARRRIEQDLAEGHHPAKNRDYLMYLSVKKRAEPIAPPKCVIDTDQKLRMCVRLALDYLRAVE